MTVLCRRLHFLIDGPAPANNNPPMRSPSPPPGTLLIVGRVIPSGPYWWIYSGPRQILLGLAHQQIHHTHLWSASVRSHHLQTPRQALTLPAQPLTARHRVDLVADKLEAR